MSVLQSKIDEIRYIRRNNLNEEAKIVGDYYRDIIRSYGVDVNYYKLKIPYINEFKPIIDENALIMHAYGQCNSPNYTVSSDMISYMEIEQDIFQMNKFGVVPNTDVNFYFDSNDFACSLAYKLGQLKEYKVYEDKVCFEVPINISNYFDYDTNDDGKIIHREILHKKIELSDAIQGDIYHGVFISTWVRLSAYDYESKTIEGEEIHTISSSPEICEMSFEEYQKLGLKHERYYLSDDIFPYVVGQKVPLIFRSEILSGRYSCVIGDYKLNTDYTVMCKVMEHGDVSKKFRSNPYIFNSPLYNIDSKEYVETLLFLDYRVCRRQNRETKEWHHYVRGKLRGAVLFRDLNKVGKYLDKIHPEIGDIVTIDFPDKDNRQRYEITDCFDKQLTNDGINPLLHQYVWKCKARRYINSGEDFPEHNEGDERWEEKIELINNVDEQIAKQIGEYDEEHNDDVYGGYEREETVYDHRVVEPKRDQVEKRLKFIDDGSWIEIFRFSDNCKLVTDGYELFYIDSSGCYSKLTFVIDERVISQNLVPSGIQYLKSTDNALWFVNFDNKSCKICEDENITQGEIEMCLNSLIDTTYDTKDNNINGQYFYKFRESNTVLMSLKDNLYCRFGNKDHKIVKIS